VKRKRSDRPVPKRILIPQSVIDKVDAQLVDPIAGKPEYGAYSKLVTSLLIRWLNGGVTVPTPLRFRNRPFCPKCLLDERPIWDRAIPTIYPVAHQANSLSVWSKLKKAL
jgi:hypothetical protein